MENLRVVFGLGNPGAEYVRTRHNAGFLVADELARRHGAGWSAERKFRAHVAQVVVGSGPVLLCQPQTYMNASGETVGAVSSFYRVSLDRLLVIADDADLPLGQLRMRGSGSSGGHHGLESIEAILGNRAYARLKVGIGRNDPGQREITGHVLGRFGPEEEKLRQTVINRAADQVECWWSAGISKAMNQFNGAVIRSETRGPNE